MNTKTARMVLEPHEMELLRRLAHDRVLDCAKEWALAIASDMNTGGTIEELGFLRRKAETELLGAVITHELWKEPVEK